MSPAIATLAAELSRIAASLGSTTISQTAPSERTQLSRQDKIGFLRAWLKRRRAMEAMFGNDLFGDPARDMLLDLYASELENRKTCVSSLIVAAIVPATTALRVLGTLTDQGLILRENDPRDRRRVYVCLADDARDRLDDWLAGTVDAISPFTG